MDNSNTQLCRIIEVGGVAKSESGAKNNNTEDTNMLGSIDEELAGLENTSCQSNEQKDTEEIGVFSCWDISPNPKIQAEHDKFHTVRGLPVAKMPKDGEEVLFVLYSYQKQEIKTHKYDTGRSQKGYPDEYMCDGSKCILCAARVNVTERVGMIAYNVNNGRFEVLSIWKGNTPGSVYPQLPDIMRRVKQFPIVISIRKVGTVGYKYDVFLMPTPENADLKTEEATELIEYIAKRKHNLGRAYKQIDSDIWYSEDIARKLAFWNRKVSDFIPDDELPVGRIDEDDF